MMGQARLSVLIVDDEPLIRRSIRRIVAAREDTVIAGECETGAQATAAIREYSPDLVLLDVQMHSGTGLEVVEQIGPENMPPVIFITAYDDYAVQAFDWNAVDYLLKPFDDDRLNRSIDRAKQKISAGQHRELADQLRSLLGAKQERGPQRLVVRSGERFDMVQVQSIEWIESANNYVQLHCGTKQYLMAETLTSLAERLDPKQFMRIHRGRIVNTALIVAVHPLFSGTYEIQLRNGMKLTTGRQYRAQIQAFLLG
jgi:two-component system, LytTR family, response regulator